MNDDDDLIQEIWNQVHKEYNLWRMDVTTTQIKCLACQSPLKLLPLKLRSNPTINLSLVPTITPVHTQSNPDFSSCTDYDVEGNESTSYLTPILVTVQKEQGFEPTPKYECCALSSANIFSAPASDLGEGALFIHFADRPELEHHIDKYIQQYTRLNKHKQPCGFLEWEANVPRIFDADFMAVRLETTRRLLAQPGFTYADLESLDQDNSLKRVLCYGDVKERDIIWRGPGDALSLLCSLDEQVKEKSSLIQDLELGFRHFCANLNCITSGCKIHPVLKCPLPDLSYRSEDPSLQVTPKKISSELRQMQLKKKSCGSQCFLIIADDELEGLSDADLLKADKDVESIMLLMPDALPCDIASISTNIECQAIYAYRKRLFPDDDILRQRQWRETEPLTRNRPKWPTKVGDRRVGPCSHQGPCSDPTVSCICREAEQYCLRNCRCGPNCNYRFRGCNCDAQPVRKKATKKKAAKKAAKKKSAAKEPLVPLCWNSRCVCHKNGRECDPEYCKSCLAKDAIFEVNQKKYLTNTNLCKNVGLQRGVVAQLEIKRCKWGFGAFAMEDIPEHSFIGEYIGEIYYTDAQAREDYWLHCKQRTNYNFEFEAGLNLDATQVGNHTRFLNDAVKPTKEGRMVEDKKALNCFARTCLVNGQTRHSIHSSKPISQGEELFLEYGDNYWHPKDRKTEGRGKKATIEPARRNSESNSMIVDDDSA